MLRQTVYFICPHVLRYVGFEADVSSMGIPRTRNIKLNARRGDALQQVWIQFQDMFLCSLDFYLAKSQYHGVDVDPALIEVKRRTR
jgi:hypothetical protein